MSESGRPHDIYLEIGQKKVFAVALDWPGWCRSGKDEAAAVQTLLLAAPRYSTIAEDAGLPFAAPDTAGSLNIVARVDGNSTTDFGAPDAQLAGDWDAVGPPELERFKRLLQACWSAVDGAIAAGTGRELQKGPRGGGRDLTKIVEHIVGAEEAYLRSLGWASTYPQDEPLDERKNRLREEILRGLEAAAAGDLPRVGPRGGQRWPSRYFVRRLAWHDVDHAWEIEDRII